MGSKFSEVLFSFKKHFSKVPFSFCALSVVLKLPLSLFKVLKTRDQPAVY